MGIFFYTPSQIFPTDSLPYCVFENSLEASALALTSVCCSTSKPGKPALFPASGVVERMNDLILQSVSHLIDNPSLSWHYIPWRGCRLRLGRDNERPFPSYLRWVTYLLERELCIQVRTLPVSSFLALILHLFPSFHFRVSPSTTF